MQEMYFFRTKTLQYIPEVGEGNWGITANKLLAEQYDPHYRLATIQDLEDLFCAAGITFDGHIKVQEGVAQWFSQEHYIHELDSTDVTCGYYLVRE